MQIEILQSDDQLLRIAVSGKMDALGVSGAELKFHAFMNDLKTPVILDFTEVTFLASMGVRMLLTALKDVTRQGQTLKIENAGDDIKKVLETAGLTGFLFVQPYAKQGE